MLHLLLEQRLREAVAKVLPDADPATLLVRPCPDPKFGDYQTNALMSLAKQRRLNPRQLAGDVLAGLDANEWCAKVEIAGAGFLNFHLKPEAIGRVLQGAVTGQPLFFRTTPAPRTIVIDFSSPNVAKPMHIGHIRSTVLGDCLARTLRLLGHQVITDNHIGDWGTQFGMLLVGWQRDRDRAALQADALSEMDRLYKKIQAECKENPATLDLVRQELVKLQSGDPERLAVWHEMIQLSQVQFDHIYGRLGVKFDHTLGESYYNPQLKGIVQELRDQQIARQSEGAWCVFSDGTLPPKEDPFLKHEDGELKPNPFLIQKSDGAFNYATTDLATLAHRLNTWHAQEIVYVTDGRQQLHFRQLFATFGRWHPELAGRVKLAHVWFGSILGEEGKPLKTRDGNPVKLVDVLEEAEQRALQVVTEKNPGLSEEQRRKVARTVGVSAVKYADLLPNRQSDYIFSWDKMLALSGNTVVYLLYAYARASSVLRKAGGMPEALRTGGEFVLTAPEELAIARHLLNFGLVIEAVAEEYRPNYLCNYLYELAGHFARFWENCPVLKAEGVQRATREGLCELTGRVLKQGLVLLGIETLEEM